MDERKVTCVGLLVLRGVMNVQHSNPGFIQSFIVLFQSVSKQQVTVNGYQRWYPDQLWIASLICQGKIINMSGLLFFFFKVCFIGKPQPQYSMKIQ